VDTTWGQQVNEMEKKGRRNRFYVDAKPYYSDAAELTGAQIKACAVGAKACSLVLHREGDCPGRVIADDDRVNLGYEPEFSTCTFGSPPH
jgi:hypothetical protein